MHLKKHCLFDLIDNSLKAVDTMSMFVQNVWSLWKHCKAIMADKWVTDNDLFMLTETQSQLSKS